MTKLPLPWFIAQLKPNGGALAQRNLARQGITTFLPQQEITHRTNDKMVTRREAVFPGYIFVGFDPDNQRHRARVQQAGKPPTFNPIGEGELSRLEIGPGLVTLLGGAPGSGKTASTMQAEVDALRLTPTLRAVVCNIEMPPGVLLDRQLARLSGVDLTTIRYRRLTAEHSERIDAGLTTLAEVCDRLAFVRPLRRTAAP